MNDNIKRLSDANALIDAFNLTKKESIWKESVQKYEINLLRNTYELRKSLRNGTYEQKDFYEFTLNERGKTRYIKSLHIKDRVVQRSLCDNILIPGLKKYLIYDNGASLQNKGIDFTRRRLEVHLHKYYRKKGSNEGYVLLLDFSKFFDNIPHEQLLEYIKTKISDLEFNEFLKKIIKTFEVDVSYLNDEEYQKCLSELFNSLEYSNIDKKLLTKEKYMKKSIGIGSQISQICGIFYPTRIDNYCKIVKQMKYYGRYMDDIYVIHEDKQVLKDLLADLERETSKLGLFINQKKTQIVKLSHGFNFLQIRYNLTESGKLIRRISKKSIIRERRKLKKYKTLFENGTLKYEDIELAYRSWRGNALKYKAYKSVNQLDKLYEKLFVEGFIKGD